MIKASAQLSGPDPKVTVNGVELDCAEVYITHRRNEFPRLVIVTDVKDLGFDFEGDLQVSVNNSVTQFLATVDPMKLEQQVMAESSFADNPIAGVLRVLKELSSAQS